MKSLISHIENILPRSSKCVRLHPGISSAIYSWMNPLSPLVPRLKKSQKVIEYLNLFPSGQFGDRRTMLGELNWIFTAITDTIAWNTLPRPLFQKLFRQDLLVSWPSLVPDNELLLFPIVKVAFVEETALQFVKDLRHKRAQLHKIVTNWY